MRKGNSRSTAEERCRGRNEDQKYAGVAETEEKMVAAVFDVAFIGKFTVYGSTAPLCPGT